MRLVEGASPFSDSGEVDEGGLETATGSGLGVPSSGKTISPTTSGSFSGVGSGMMSLSTMSDGGVVSMMNSSGIPGLDGEEGSAAGPGGEDDVE